MQDKQREQRRLKRLQKQKKKREDASRPGLGGPTQKVDPAKGVGWDLGECWATLEWDEPGATVDLILTRAREDGVSVAAFFTIDRAGPGLVAAKATGGLRQEHVAGEAARISERTGRQMVATGPGLVAALVDDARERGSNPEPAGFPEAFALLSGVVRSRLDVPFGPPSTEPESADRAGLLGSLRKRLFG
jgi:hypothetical protein